ncbi:unnamed protein product [Prunus armeniaca]
MKQAAIQAKAEYFNSKSGPSARQEEPALKGYPGQGSPYAPRRTDESSESTNGKTTVIIGREVQRKDKENTVGMTTALPYLITIALKKSLPC